MARRLVHRVFRAWLVRCGWQESSSCSYICTRDAEGELDCGHHWIAVSARPLPVCHALGATPNTHSRCCCRGQVLVEVDCGQTIHGVLSVPCILRWTGKHSRSDRNAWNHSASNQQILGLVGSSRTMLDVRTLQRYHLPNSGGCAFFAQADETLLQSRGMVSHSSSKRPPAPATDDGGRLSRMVDQGSQTTYKTRRKGFDSRMVADQEGTARVLDSGHTVMQLVQLVQSICDEDPQWVAAGYLPLHDLLQR
jgi:hypothetical protein